MEFFHVTEKSNVTIEVLEGSHGLPSVDPATSEILFLIKMQNISKIKIEVCRYSASVSLPRLNIDGVDTYHIQTILNILKRVVDIDSFYRAKTASRITAYKFLMQEKLEPAVLLNNWGTEDNILISTKLYIKGIKFPFQTFFARNLRRKMQSEVENICNDSDVLVVKDDMYAKATSCLNDLNNILGNKKYLFGEEPTTADVHLCAYLSHVLLIKYADNRLNSIIQAQTPNLVIYVNKFVAKYGIKSDRPDIEINPRDNERAPLVMIAGAGFVAVSTMMLYAVLNGIFRVRH